jgi:hypothetical protein
MVATVDPIVFERPLDRAGELDGRPGIVRFLELAPRRAVLIDGTGAPGPRAFEQRLPGLYTTAYATRFALKARGIVERVGPLEGLWWTTDGTSDLEAVFGSDRGRDDWRWILFIGLPDEATDEDLAVAVEKGRDKLADHPALAASLRMAVIDEGRVAQLIHVGPYATERASIERLHAAIEAEGLQLRGRHHEIYLGDPRTAAPERLRTILRHPVEQGSPGEKG